ncbi:hypothetical protein CFIMG_001307RA [Ceratocystis fimbriata CBS 114723]|uniref:GPI-anchored cupredoxin n=1 Tax=Ceratocystis fimbriata CBS 114723 TaxID=1035309 RepID=A0A2C5XEE1_9PEZI|nr:hypothetical protein CFIMG_001307RA [Ceratocystis fimbriata CBS 114723]
MRFTFFGLLSAAAALASPCQFCNENGNFETRRPSITVVEVLPTGIFPNEVHALVGDYILFKFGDGLNSVVQGRYESPCRSYQGGFSSGAIWNLDVETYYPKAYVIQITDARPIWYYNGEEDKCRIGGHLAVINPPANGVENLYSYLSRSRVPGITDWKNQNKGVMLPLSEEACQRKPR